MQEKEEKAFSQSPPELTLICGPCVIEDRDTALSSAEFLKKLSVKLDIPLIYKSSYDKANRSSVHSFRGPGIDQGLSIMEEVKKEFALPVLTDVHSPTEATKAGYVCDYLQIPAFLCRQTDLLLAAGQTGRGINVKKGQFMAPWDMKHVVEKLESTGNKKIILTDRGTSFGYNNLVADMRSIPIMQEFGYPVCFDVTHAVQLPGGNGATSGGQNQFVAPLAKCAVTLCHHLFIEAHPDPKRAKSDAATQVPFDQLEALLTALKQIHTAAFSGEAAHV